MFLECSINSAPNRRSRLRIPFGDHPLNLERYSVGATCAMVLVQWALLHEMRLMTTFDGLKHDRRREEKRRTL